MIMDLSSVGLCSIVSQQITKSVKAPKWLNHKIWATVVGNREQCAFSSVFISCGSSRVSCYILWHLDNKFYFCSFVFCTSIRWYIFIFMLFLKWHNRRQRVWQCTIANEYIIKINTLQFQWTLLNIVNGFALWASIENVLVEMSKVVYFMSDIDHVRYWPVHHSRNTFANFKLLLVIE